MPNSKLPSVCVCVPSYNAAKTIAASLASILAQTYENIQVLVIDNASSDETVRISDTYAARDPRVKVLRNVKNIGGEGNFTRCIQSATGDYTCIYHADDMYEPEIIAREVGFLEEHPKVGAVFCAARDIDESGRVIAARNLPATGGISKGGVFNFQQVLRTVLKIGNFMIFPSAMVRTEIYKNEIKAWNATEFSTAADLDVWLRIAEKHSLGFINRPLMRYRVSPSSYSYNFLRLKTIRDTMFLVLDFYIKKYAGSVIGPKEMADYRLLLLKDDTSIAINLLIKGERAKARLLLSPVFRLENMLDSLKSRGQFKMYSIGIAAFVLSLVPIGAMGRRLLAKARHN
jgi:glycosyltransferase involved in cell wall biosynthesis